MFEYWIALSRFVQFGGAAVLFGAPLFLMCGQPFAADIAPDRLLWTTRLLLAAAIAVALATLTGFVTQTAMLAGSLSAVADFSTLKAALFEMNFGVSSAVRLTMALLAVLAAGFAEPGPPLWRVCFGLGAIVCASFAWMGHGAATEGWGWLIHLAGDVTHSLAAAAWVGALVVFCILLVRPMATSDGQKALCASLAGFSSMGSLLVALIVASGLINSFFLVGWNPLQIATTRYGQVLALKLVLFSIMLGLATANRFRHTPRLAEAIRKGEPTTPALSSLRQSIMIETAMGAGVLALVSWLGTLAPVTAQ